MINWYEIPFGTDMKNNHCIRISEMPQEKIDVLKEVQEKVEKMAEKLRKSILSSPGTDTKHKDKRQH